MKNKLLTVIALNLIVMTVFLVGCGKNDFNDKAQNNIDYITVTDSIGRKVSIAHPANKVVVANAYNAELINALDGIEQIIGVDYYIYQDQVGFGHRFSEDMLIGQSKGELNYEKIISLKPDVLIMTSNSPWQEAERKLAPFGIPVLAVDSYFTEQFEANVNLLGTVLGKDEQAKELTDYFVSKLDYIKQQLKDVPRKSVYFEYRTAGRTTINNDYFYNMVNFAHGDNVFKDAQNANIDIEAVVTKNPEYIVKVSSTNVYSSYLPPSVEDMVQIKQEIMARPSWEYINAVKNNHILLLSHYVHGGASKLIGTFYIAKFMYPEYLSDLHPEEIFYTWTNKYQKLEYKPGHTYPAFGLEE